MKLGFIGAGNMASAILGGILASGSLAPEHIYMSDPDQGKRAEKSALGIHATSDNREVLAQCDTCILAVKPQILPSLLDELKRDMKEDTLFISIVAGISIKKIKKMAEKDIKVIRVMPNTPILVGEGMSVLSADDSITPEEMSIAENLFALSGKTARLPEKLMDTVTAASGSSPAYVFMMIEAMADAAVAGGIPRQDAYEICAQAVLGSAKMVLETGIHPGELKDMVCSPGGTTIEAVKELEKNGFRYAVESAMRKCAKKSKELGD